MSPATGARPPVVLLHGVGLDASMWGPVRALLVADGFEVLTPDLPGHGSNPPVAAGTTLADLAAAVAGQVPAGAVVVGFSLGALVAQHLARFRPDLVGALVSLNSVCRRTPEERAAVLGRLAASEADFAAGAEASLRRWFEGTAVPAAVVARTREVLLANDRESFLACYRVFATADAEIGPELPRIDRPALAVTGELDGGSTPEMTHRLAGAIPGCEAVVVPGARHMLPVTDPEPFVSILTTFVRKRSHVAASAN
ncbi:alpha/beta fold hydrolase [Kineococcus gynurae]|uniref:Alpha/beta fold hydrolase n=1 Tax=Kineococcus gynurae TaxID=452979 RepID=A0ABV5LPI0_9ACTN